MSDQEHIRDCLHHIHQALDAISDGSAAFNSSSWSTRSSGASSPSRLNSHWPSRFAPKAQRSPWDRVVDINTGSVAVNGRQGAQEVHQRQIELRAQQNTDVDVWQQWIFGARHTAATAGGFPQSTSHASTPEPMQTATASPVQQANPVQVFPPPLPRTPVSDPIKSTITVGKVQRTSPPEIFLRPYSEGPMPDPIKSQGTTKKSPFRPARTIRRVGRLISRDEIPFRGFGGGKKKAQDSGEYVLVPVHAELRGIDRRSQNGRDRCLETQC